MRQRIKNSILGYKDTNSRSKSYQILQSSLEKLAHVTHLRKVVLDFYNRGHLLNLQSTTFFFFFSFLLFSNTYLKTIEFNPLLDSGKENRKSEKILKYKL